MSSPVNVVPFSPHARQRTDIHETKHFYFFFLLLFLLSLLNDLDRQFHLVRLFVRVQLHERLHISVHDGGACLDQILLFAFLLGILAPFHRLFLLVLVVIGKIENLGALKLEGAYSGDGELAFLQPLSRKDGNGFVGRLGGNLVNTCLCSYYSPA